jgi:hypothetical protein
VQLAGGKLPNRLRHSRAAHDHAHWNNRDLKRDIAHGVRNGLHFAPARMSDELLPRILPNRKIKRAAVRFLLYTASFQLPCRPAACRRRGPPGRPMMAAKIEAAVKIGDMIRVRVIRPRRADWSAPPEAPDF